MESIDKLRSRIIDSTLSNQTREEFERIADEIEAEIAEKYMKLPVDKNGEVVYIGDELYYEGYNQQFKVGCISIQYAHAYVKDAPNGDTWKPEECVHVKPDPLKELLNGHLQEREKIVRKLESSLITLGEAESEEDACDKLFADRIRELLLGGDA